MVSVKQRIRNILDIYLEAYVLVLGLILYGFNMQRSAWVVLYILNGMIAFRVLFNIFNWRSNDTNGKDKVSGSKE